jgi:putative ABC transport system permease protein
MGRSNPRQAFRQTNCFVTPVSYNSVLLNKLVLSNLAHRPVRTILSVLAIAIEVTMILTLVGVSYGTLHSAARRAEGVGADIAIRPVGSSIMSLSSAPMSDRLPGVLSTDPHIALATGIMVQPLAGFDSITGLNLDEFNKMSGGFHYLQGGPFAQDSDVLVDEYYAREKHLHVGDTLQLINHTWRVAGIYEGGKLARICVKLSALQEYTGNPHKISQVYLKLDDKNQIHPVLDALKLKLPGYQIYSMEELVSMLSVSNVGMLKNFINVVIGIAGIVGFIVVFMAMYTAVLERTREIGILKSVGSSSSLILGLLFRETIVLALVGTVLGILLTYGTQWLMQDVVPNSLTQETVYAWWPISAAIAIIGALLGTVVPGIKAVQQDATEALSYE